VLHAADAPAQLLNFAAAIQRGENPQPSPPVPVAAPCAANSAASGAQPVIPLVEMERRAIVEALEFTKGDRVMAAHMLGIGRTTLYRKLKEYGIKG
jgi:two-component system response regulator HydG